MRLFAFLATLLLAFPATAAWTQKPDGNGGGCSLKPGRACYFDVDATGNSDVLVGGACSQINTRVAVESGTLQLDIQGCPSGSGIPCSNLKNGTDITATTDPDAGVLAPDGGVAAGIRVVVDTCSSCDGEVEVFCGGSN